MKFLQKSLTVIAAIAACGIQQISSHPNPNEIIIARAVNCKAVTGVLGAIKALGAPATSFCSSYLCIPATTTVHTTITPTEYTTFTAPAVTTVVEDPNCNRAISPNRRGITELEERNALRAWKGYAAGEVSSACRCLSLTPKATMVITKTEATVTVTDTVTPTSTSTICTGCTPVGQPCIFQQPELCCTQTCACISGICNCYAFPEVPS